PQVRGTARRRGSSGGGGRVHLPFGADHRHQRRALEGDLPAHAFRDDGPHLLPQLLAAAGVEPAREFLVVREVGGGEIRGEPDLPRGDVTVHYDVRPPVVQLQGQDAVRQL